MGKRGPKPKHLISTEWSANLAYAVGLIASDGSLSKDRRHISLVSKDIEQIENFNKCLGINLKPGKSYVGNVFSAYRLQIGSVLFYEFLVSIGFTPAKTKTIGIINVPNEYFFDFLRGSFDGDGCFYSYWDPRWKSSHMFYTEFISASRAHIEWIQNTVILLSGIKGAFSIDSKVPMYRVRYAKKESLEIIKKMYYSHDVVSLSRKRLKIKKALEIEIERQARY